MVGNQDWPTVWAKFPKKHWETLVRTSDLSKANKDNDGFWVFWPCQRHMGAESQTPVVTEIPWTPQVVAVEMVLYALASLTSCWLSWCQRSLDDCKGMWNCYPVLAHSLPFTTPTTAVASCIKFWLLWLPSPCSLFPAFSTSMFPFSFFCQVT